MPPGPGANTDEQPSFINHDYFRMLARSLPGSTENSAPPSPRRRTIQPARSRLSSPPVVPPPNAEFVSSIPAPPSPAHGISETAFTPEYFEKFFIIEKELGRGGRGVVLLVKHVLDGVTLGHFACKRVPIGDDHAWLEKVLVEVQALQTLSHQNLVSYRHVWLEDYQINTFGPSVPCAFILQQYCNGGDLHNYVCGSAQVTTTTQELKERIRRRSKGETELPRKLNEPKKLSFDEIYTFFRDITSGIRFLHLNGFIHRDLKPSNCLLHSVGGEARVLVSDFGEVQYENATRKSTGATGTISYCAPEVLRKEIPDGPFGNFTFKSDIFSLGMILHFLCFANLPYKAADVLHEELEDLTELRAEIVSWAGFDEHRKLRPELPSRLYTFLKRLLSLEPDDRPSADEVDKGIRLGGFEQMPETTRRRQSLSPEELTPSRRVHKLDSPGPTILRRRKTSVEPLGLGLSGTSPNSPFEDDTDETPSSTDMQRTLSAPVKTRDLSALVPQVSSPSRSPPPGQEQRPQQRLLLPPPPPSTRFSLQPIRNILNQEIRSPLTRVFILAIKLVSVIQPCISSGLNPFVIYPLLAVAVLEMTVSRLTRARALAAMTLHFMILGYLYWNDTLCRWTRGRGEQYGSGGGTEDYSLHA